MPGASYVVPVSAAPVRSSDSSAAVKYSTEKKSHGPPGILRQATGMLTSDLTAEAYVAKRKRANTMTISDHLYYGISSPGSSIPALSFAVFLCICALSSVMINAFQISFEAAEAMQGRSCPKADPSQSSCDFDGSLVLDSVFIVVFGLEILLRVFVCVRPWRDLFLWVDVVCLSPLVLRVVLAMHGVRPFELDQSARVVCLVGYALMPLRLLKIARYSSAAVILKRAIIDSSSALWIPFYMLAVIFTFVGGVVFAFEYEPGSDDGARVSTLLEAWWMMLVTMLTVGYGDFSPRSDVGRVLTGLLMCLGVCFTAMPLAIVGNTFTVAWEARGLSLISQNIKKHLLLEGHTSDSLEAAFADFDMDGNGSIDYFEFKSFLLDVLVVPLNVQELRKVWKALDQDDSNIIKYHEFCVAIFPEFEVTARFETEGPAGSASEPPAAPVPSPVRPFKLPNGLGVHAGPPSAAEAAIKRIAGQAGLAGIEARLAALEAKVDAAANLQGETQALLREVLAQIRGGAAGDGITASRTAAFE